MLSLKCVGGSQVKRVAGEGDILEKAWKPIQCSSMVLTIQY